MAISINWATRVITVPQADLTPAGGSLYLLDVNAFRLALKSIEDSEEGAAFPVTHEHNTAVTLSGDTYARQVIITNGYTITFEEVGSPYRVKCVGANHNISDVQNLNNVSLIVGNSAGLIQISTGSGLSVEQDATLSAIKTDTDTLKTAVQRLDDIESGAWRIVGTQMIFFKPDGTTELMRFDLKDGAGTPSATNVTRRDRA